MILKELLKDWTDQDVAQYYLACCLGLMEFDESFTNFVNAKSVFWSGNSIQKMLFEMFEKMREVGMVDFDENTTSYRWNSLFKGYWEKT